MNCRIARVIGSLCSCFSLPLSIHRAISASIGLPGKRSLKKQSNKWILFTTESSREQQRAAESSREQQQRAAESSKEQQRSPGQQGRAPQSHSFPTEILGSPFIFNWGPSFPIHFQLGPSFPIHLAGIAASPFISSWDPSLLIYFQPRSLPPHSYPAEEIRRSGDPEIRRSIRRSRDPEIRRSEDPEIRRSGDPERSGETRRP
jgi:hypothetical protein